MLFHISPSSLLLTVGVVAFLLVAVAGLSARRRNPSASYRRKAVLSPWERKALGTLGSQLRPGLHLCPQVHLGDMLSIDAADGSLRRGARNRVASKSVDFCVVDAVTGDPVLVIELDDKSHGRADRQARDVLVNSVLREAGIPIARFKPSQRLDIRPHLDAALAAVSVGMKIAAE